MKKSRLVATVLVVSCLLSCISGCGLLKKKNKTPWQDEVRDQMPDKITNENIGSFYLEGHVYSFPCQISEFLENGWDYSNASDKTATVNPHASYQYVVELKLTTGKNRLLNIEAYNDSDESCDLKDCYTSSLKMNNYSGNIMIPGDISIQGVYFKSSDEIANYAAEDVVFTDASSYANGKQTDFKSKDGYSCSVIMVFEKGEQDLELMRLMYSCSFTISVTTYVDATLQAVTKNDPSIINEYDRDNSGERFLESARLYYADTFLYIIGFDFDSLTDELNEKCFQYMDMVFSKAESSVRVAQDSMDSTVMSISYTAPDDFDSIISDIIAELAESYEGDQENLQSDPVFASLFMDALIAKADEFTYTGRHFYEIYYEGDQDQLDTDIDSVILCMLGLYPYIEE